MSGKKPQYALERIARFEESVARERDWPQGWSWRQVRVWPATLNRLCLEGYLETVFRSNSYTGYKLTEAGRAAAVAGDPKVSAQSVAEAPQSLPQDLFDDVIGHGEVKELLRAALSAARPVHVLLAGPPALAKSLFLWDIEMAYGEGSLWLLGSAVSKAGLWDLVAERQPRVLLVDEVDRMSASDAAGLLSLMEGGRLVRAKKGRALDSTVALWVIAATNHLERLSPELRSRFAVRDLQPYSAPEYLAVVRGVLAAREGVPAELAAEIAQRLDGWTQDVRDAVRVARLAPQVGVERAVALLLGRD